MRLELGNASISTRSTLFLMIMFLLSLLHPATVLLFYLFLVLEAVKQPVEGSIRGLVSVMFRGQMSTALAADISGLQMIKWVMLLGLSVWLLFNTRHSKSEKRVSRCMRLLLLFSLFAIIASWLNGSYPTVSFFKVIAFTIPCCAVIKGVCLSADYDWNHFLFKVLSLLFIISVILLPFDRFRIVNRDFQGVFNHVNGMGTICAIYIAIILNEKRSVVIRGFIRKTVLIVIVLLVEFQTKSRTGMFSAIGVLVCYSLALQIKFRYKLVALVLGLLCAYAVSLLLKGTDNVVGELINTFVYKGHSGDLLFSRNSQLRAFATKMSSSYVFGGGFMTPYQQGYQDYRFSFDLVVEPGNLVLTLLADTGIVGFILFLFFMISVGFAGDRSALCVACAVFLTNMGEMVFFSSNSEGILMYLLLAIYMSSRILIRESYVYLDY